MPLTQIFQKLFKRSQDKGRISMEVRPDGIAWVIGSSAGQQEVGFIECTPAKRLRALQEFVAQRDLSGGTVELVLPLDQYQVFQLDRPEGVEDAELADALKWKLKDVLEFSPSDSVSDVFPFPADAARGRGELVNVVAARRSLVAELVSLMKDADLDLARIEIAELALRNLVSRLDVSGRGASLVQLRDRFGHMVICKGPTLYLSRRLDVVSDDLRDVARQESAVQSLALEVQRSLDYYESQLGQVPPPIVHLVARDTLLPLTSMLGGYLAASARTVDWSDFGLDRGLDSRCLLAWSASLGLPEEQQ